MNHLSIIRELGPAANLLLESDDWLENERKRLATELAMASTEFYNILTALKWKRAIQQTNSVAVRIIERDEYGSAIDVHLCIMPITEALKALNRSRLDKADVANEEAQRSTWSIDGYDVQTAERLIAV